MVESNDHIGNVSLGHFSKGEWRPNEKECILMAKEIKAFRELRRQIMESDRSCDPETGEDTTLEHMQHLCKTMSFTSWPPWGKGE